MEKTDKEEILETITTISRQTDIQISDLTEVINTFSSAVDDRFDKIDNRFNKIEATMVTKDYLDEKLADLSGDLVVLLRKEDRKLGALVKELVSNKTPSEEAAKRVLSMELFPQIQL